VWAREWELRFQPSGSIYRWPLRAIRPQVGGGQAVERSLLLEGFKVLGAVGAQKGEVETHGAITARRQPPQPLAQQHGGSPQIAPFAMEVGHGDLENALDHRAIGLQGFMPEGFEAIVTGIPVTLIKLVNGLSQAGISRQI
jgi:hypothetical protein